MARNARRSRDRESRCEERKRNHRFRNENEGQRSQCTRCGKGLDECPDGLTYGCENCRMKGDGQSFDGGRSSENTSLGCGAGMPAAKLAGGVSFCSPNEDDSMWCCEPCNTIETNIDELEDRVHNVERGVAEA